MSARTSTSACAGFALAVACFATGSQADVSISSGATANMVCSAGVCAPTAKNAVLNISDLENLLASGNVTVTTTGSGGVQANDIRLDAALAWSSADMLVLDAYESIRVERPVTVSGFGGLSIKTNDGGNGGYFSFGSKGHATFADLSSALTINGMAYVLVGDIRTLASGIAANSAGNYALANSYDASQDGTYQNSPIPTEFSGSFEGLGNTISNLSLNGTGDYNAPVGLFAELAANNQPGGAAENISLRKLRVAGSGFEVGGLVGVNAGSVTSSFVSGSLASDYQQGSPAIGALVGANAGTIARSGAEGTISSAEPLVGGGLAGGGAGSVIESYANCKVSGGNQSSVGGLVGVGIGPISQSYAAGNVKGGDSSDIGGLVGYNASESTIAQTYSTAAVRGGKGYPHGYRGGLIGVDYSPSGSNSSDYWDTTTSRIMKLSRGAGAPRSDPGITGLTTTQLQSGLPAGFDPKVWAENPNINGGFPYLINNPPPK